MIKELTAMLGLLVILAACGCVEKGSDLDKNIQNLKDTDSSVRLQAAKDLAKTIDAKTASIDPKAIDPLIEVLLVFGYKIKCEYENLASYNWAVFTICSFNVPFLNEATISTQSCNYYL